MIDQIQFFRQFRTQSKTTGSILPSSRFLARAMTGPMESRRGPLRILEVGPGTGAVTRRIVRFLKPEDRFDLVEINPSFAQRLKNRFLNDPVFERVASQSHVHACALKEFESDQSYDFILSGLPMNNFSADLVRETFDCFF
ncbi:MAG: methyltransferase domain-containing protein, partial [Planctomycetes bacterium]|nr:methyltransferase domain-containing protein [Planctomycetota bacterium]